jgi:tetratricopeptide (TPR) repeat protein
MTVLKVPFLKCFFAILFISFCQIVHAQDLKKLLDSLQLKETKATNAADKIEANFEIASRFITIDPAKGAETIEKIIYLGEGSRDKNLICRGYRYAAAIYGISTTNKAFMDKAYGYAEKAYQIAKEINENTPDKMAAVAVFSRINRSLNKNDAAIRYANEAVSISDENGDDSLKIVSRIGLSLAQLSASQKIESFKSLIAAQSIMEALKEDKRKTALKLRVYQSLATFFLDIKNYDKAIDYEYKILDIHKKEKNVAQEIVLLTEIGNIMVRAKKFDAGKKVFESVIQLASANKDLEDMKINGNVGMISCFLEGEKPEEGLNYLRSHPEIKTVYGKYNLSMQFDFIQAFLFTAANQFDSGKYYYDRTYNDMVKMTSTSAMPNVLFQYSYYFYKTKQYPKTIELLKSAVTINDSLKKSTDNIEYYKYLDSCYQQMNDTKNSLFYKNKLLEQSKILDEMNKEKDVLSLEIDAENKRKERAKTIKLEETQKRHNWQYMGILVVILALFSLLASFGIFKVSEKLIKILGFVAFILLFEFIILIADTWIHHATHGEPWKILGIKVVLIALLLPLHHYLEHKAVHYITNRHKEIPKQ